MYGFVVVLIFIFFGFALIAVEFDQTQISYGDQLYGTFKILFASYDDGEYNVSQKLFTSLIVFLLNVVLLNLLISIMGDTYDKVQERRILIDSLTTTRYGPGSHSLYEGSGTGRKEPRKRVPNIL